MDYLDNPERRRENAAVRRTSANSYGFGVASTQGRPARQLVKITVRRYWDLFDLSMTGESGFRPADLVVYSAGNNRMIGFRELSAATFQEFWRGGCFGGFLFGRPDSQSSRGREGGS